ncbi:M81 family metallopeptidase [Albibacillus kandeliae]|uniref:M81 family metallopeptidase n=1 Tax=Albibacillus kandeliae TaxID=2174228 RepID=UPI000D69E181|nr:M81 family metallopeptidase [Albibacillus kandeliae]
MPYRVAFAGFMLESVSAVPVVSTKAEFEQRMTRGAELLDGFRGTNTVAGGCLDVLEAADDVTPVPLLQTLIGALGPASDEAISYLTAEILRALADAGPLDGIVLFLHGASWAPGYPDIERHIIDEVRKAMPGIPLAIALDYHGNVDSRTFANCDVAVAYRHSPHTDMGQTGQRATEALMRILREGRKPGLALCKPGVIIPSILSATRLEPLASVIAEARAMEAEGDCDISIMAGFSYADSPNTGMSVLAIDWDGQEAAEAKVRKLAERLHDLRREISNSIEVMDVAGALTDLEASPGNGKPVVLLEHADRMNDSTYLLRALIGRDVGRVAVPFLLDPETAELALKAGEGAEIEVAIGGKSSPESGGPVHATAKVLWAGTKSYKVTGPMETGKLVNLGTTALLDIGNIRVSVVSAFAFGVDGDPFYIFGEKPEDYDVIVLRSKTHFRAFYEPASDRIIVVDTPDLGPADVRLIAFEQLQTAQVYPWLENPPLTN